MNYTSQILSLLLLKIARYIVWEQRKVDISNWWSTGWIGRKTITV